MSRVNDVTLFSNGIGHFRRVYEVDKEQVVSIPFKTDSIGDVAASLQVFGKVKLLSPPSFTPANSNATSLRIDPDEAMRSLLQQLSGAKVSFNVNSGKEEGTLLGVQRQQRYTSQGNLEDEYLVVLTADGVVKRDLTYVHSITFLEEAIQAEIAKALKSNFQKIKPDSTLLELSLVAIEGKTEAVVQYTIPVAAWKMRYAIRQDDGGFVLEGAAIIDNNTDEDWDNFQVSVVTGNPISFLTDIANVVVPHRRFVSLVDGDVLGNVNLEEGTRVMCAAAPSSSSRPSSSGRGLAAKMSVANVRSFGLEDARSLQQMASGDSNLDVYYTEERAEAPGVDAKDVGDFCVFTSKEPITLLARKSAVVPMFSANLKQGGIVLLYKEENHARRPYRAVKFKNETAFSLGRGKTLVYNNGVFSGECVLEATKPGENRMLPHCLENGVKVVKERKDYQSRLNAIRISEGVAIQEQVDTAVTKYNIENKKAEPFKFALEHVGVLGGTDVRFTYEGLKIADTEKLSNGVRLYFDLDASQSVTLTVTEVSVRSQSIQLGDFGWLSGVIVNKPLARDPAIQRCAEIQETIDKIGEEIRQTDKSRSNLVARAQRVRDNLGAVQNGPKDTAQKWVADLDSIEQQIRSIDEEKSSALQARLVAARGELQEALKKILTTWIYKEPEAFKVVDTKK